MNDYVIVHDYDGDRRFYSGKAGKWVSEYPDAETYPDEETALQALNRLEERAALVHRYGYVDERVLCWSR